jgi:hypothetical protein
MAFICLLDVLSCLVMVQRHFKGHHSMRPQHYWPRSWQVHLVSGWIITKIWAVTMLILIVLLSSSVSGVVPIFLRLHSVAPTLKKPFREGGFLGDQNARFLS